MINIFFIFFFLKPHLSYIPDDRTFTTGIMAGVVGVVIIGGVANTAIAATGKYVQNGTLIFYAGFARYENIELFFTFFFRLPISQYLVSWWVF